MKRFYQLSLAAALLCLPALASNTVNLIGLSAPSIGMGGTGVSNFTSATDAVYKNPSLLGLTPLQEGHSTKIELTLGVVKQNTKGNYTVGTTASGDKDNQAGANFVPDLAASYRINDRFHLGFGILPYSGAGSDYTGESLIFAPKVKLSLIKFSPALSYKVNEWIRVGAAPFITRGSFQVNEAALSAETSLFTKFNQTTREASSAVGVGANLGVSAEPVKGLMLGASYISKSNFNYKSLLNLDLYGKNFPTVSAAGGTPHDMLLQQPDEIALGASYLLSEGLTVAFDWRNIRWSQADGYKDFGFSSQNVFALGAQYQLHRLTFRAGFNYAASPLADATGEVGADDINIQGHTVWRQFYSLLDVFAFPAISQTHITAGVGYKFCDAMTLDVAGYYSPKSTLTRSGNNASLPTFGLPAAYSYTTSVTQWALNGTLTYSL
jgi:long-chain fatty acid transport protein